MKKLFLVISTIFLVLLGTMTISVSAARYTELPITMNQEYYGTNSMFTMTDFEIYVSLNETPKYTKSAEIYISGAFNNGSSMIFAFYCYDASGNHIETITKTVTSSDFEDYLNDPYCYLYFDIPDVTASIEIGTAYPGSWTNTYYYCKYMNVYSDDGRALAIHDLLLEIYENCGWHGPVWMYSLDGRSIEIPYCDIAAYKKVGWYLWEDYNYLQFKQDYEKYSKQGDYYAASLAIDNALDYLTGTYYESSLYGYKTNLLDAWRKKINGPLAYCSHSVDKSNGEVSITFKNVSYKYITAFKIQLDCYDTFGEYIDDYYDYYYVDDAWIPSGEYGTYYWDTTYSTDYVRNIRVTQVVYSDGTTWYR